MKRFLIFVFILASVYSSAQHEVTFSSQNYIGLLVGEQGSKTQLQTINGAKFKTWFVGLGTGIDWYHRRSIPLFISVDKDFLKKGNRNFFIAANAGLNFPWKDDKNYNEGGYTIEKTPAGFYWETGLGYRIGVGKKNDAILLQVGYSYKHIREDIKDVYYTYAPNLNIPVWSPQPEITNRIDYYLNRLSLKIGWNF
jgi:hypothetical protein